MRESTQSKTINGANDAAGNQSYDEIAALAYQLWQDRGCPTGSPEQDWFQAEAELNNRGEAAAAAA